MYQLKSVCVVIIFQIASISCLNVLSVLASRSHFKAFEPLLLGLAESGHPKVKAFIPHGGLLGTMEAVHSGTPMVVIPHGADQPGNAQAISKAGGGVILYMSEATEETIHQAITTVLGPKFQNQMKELSERFRDRPMSPLNTAIYWVEYVARHKGAHFMKTAAVNMPFYQYYLLDVLAFIIFVLSVVSYIICITVRAVIRMIFGSSIAKPETKQKKS